MEINHAIIYTDYSFNYALFTLKSETFKSQKTTHKVQHTVK